MNTYKTLDEANRDKALLEDLRKVLDASFSAMRRDTAGLWVLQGSRGYCATWGDSATFGLTVGDLTGRATKQAWTWVKKRLAFTEVTQDGEGEGVFRLHQLPSPEQADEIRDILGIRKRTYLSTEEAERRRSVLKRNIAHKDNIDIPPS